MKYSVIALLALSAICFTSCQNSPKSPDSSSDSALPAAPDAKTLNEQILTELVEGKRHSRQFDSVFVQYNNLGRAMASAYSVLEPENMEKVNAMRKGMREFTEPYEWINACAIQLDSLSSQLNSGRKTLEETQKEFNSVRNQMRQQMENLSKSSKDIEKYRTEFEAVYNAANKKAAGGQ